MSGCKNLPALISAMTEESSLLPQGRKMCSPLAVVTPMMDTRAHLQDQEASVIIIKDGRIEWTLIGCIFS